jgi:DNA topoisomerase II
MNNEPLAKAYQKKTEKQHILDNPDTYTGSMDMVEEQGWVFDNKNNKIINTNFNYIPGLYKLFDEGIVNCRDHVIRMSKKQKENPQEKISQVSYISISINEENGMITMVNDGEGIDIEKHPEYNIWIPELIFGNLRTSTNYNKEEKKIVGGKNGFGFKLVLIWSTYGEIETVDAKRGLKYTQVYKNNLEVKEEPNITKCKTKPYTRVSFIPDFQRLGISKFNEDFIRLFKKRVYDICAITPKNIKVKLNDELLPIKTFTQYVDYYIGDKGETKRLYETPNERWEYIVCETIVDEFACVSFVNGIYTSKGGKHVDYIMNQIIRKLCLYIKNKKKVDVKPTAIKEQLMIFLRCDIENPSFDSQTKDYMNTPVTKFGSSCNVSDKLIEDLAKMGIMQSALQITEIKQTKDAKKTDGNKTKTIRGIPKLVDANNAGTKNSKDCILIFCEGDSAKAGIVSGLSKEDRNIIGVYPMKGKIMNVRGEAIQKINTNKEISEIKQILGLETSKVYESIQDVYENLRYGRIMFMTDQDLDGSHIKGLGINLFGSHWNSLFKLDGFIGFMNTPILKAKKNSQTLLFYNEGEYNKWKETNNSQGWNIKYYKGLGTSTGSEFKDYFKNKKIVGFNYSGDCCENNIDKVFNKKRSDDRKEWLKNYNRKDYLNTDIGQITYSDFINKEFIHFSKYDCDRSIPNVMDGLKISLRKILYSAFKKNLTKEIKVAQFSGYVSEHSGYHHGEASLNAAIVGMAQDYVGSNNINLLMPNGQFGTRLVGGKDSASERYIFTELNKITRMIYNPLDDNILNYLDDDGTFVEPLYYLPILPMILVNGTKGIGTGFSTEVMCYNPKELANILLKMLTGDPSFDLDLDSLIPFYKGFKGTIHRIEAKKYLFKGVYKITGKDSITITELPIGNWTDDYKAFLETLIDGGEKKKPILRHYVDLSTDTNVEITVNFVKGGLAKLDTKVLPDTINDVEKILKLTCFNNTSNIHLFNHEDKLVKYDSVKDIVKEYFDVRLSAYDRRKTYILNQLKKELKVLSNKEKYIKDLLEDKIDLRRKTKIEITDLMKTHKFDLSEETNDFNYLIKMSMDMVSSENVSKLMKEKQNKQDQCSKLESTTVKQLWIDELCMLSM